MSLLASYAGTALLSGLQTSTQGLLFVLLCGGAGLLRTWLRARDERLGLSRSLRTPTDLTFWPRSYAGSRFHSRFNSKCSSGATTPELMSLSPVSEAWSRGSSSGQTTPSPPTPRALAPPTLGCWPC
ncbi:hypothetical protein FA09DRAFT_341334 [Tilletiopsis washingtonensis]|jgi:hypothetical protein|uniref:Uncharacterized protein n=1 Tax=Tilletiopsis washingtonensis TaxID=58919 RepID=A0A316Z0R5_9BASI|nr:hypothetical protein FA09DRAFT_341334 [Tilletiopsis washingtonensis]PWN95119.1 hypothetical protein FA09DRAFT_341334 [Tilletiopsis washingtonensis]